QRRRPVHDVVRAQRAKEALQDAMVERALLAVIDLQLPLRIVDVDHAEDVLEQKLLRTLAEVFELSGRDRLQRFLEVFGEARDVAVEDGVGAGTDQELGLSRSCE